MYVHRIIGMCCSKLVENSYLLHATMEDDAEEEEEVAGAAEDEDAAFTGAMEKRMSRVRWCVYRPASCIGRTQAGTPVLL